MRLQLEKKSWRLTGWAHFQSPRPRWPESRPRSRRLLLLPPLSRGTCPSSRPDGNRTQPPTVYGRFPVQVLPPGRPPTPLNSHNHISREHITPPPTHSPPSPSSIGARRSFIPLLLLLSCCFFFATPIPTRRLVIPNSQPPIDPRRLMVFSAAASPLVATAAAPSCAASLRRCCRVGCCCCC
jgi:hypothetical protein